VIGSEAKTIDFSLYPTWNLASGKVVPIPTLHGSTLTVKHLLPNQLVPLDSKSTAG
tara:strand:- start:163 stop:330 length:168 start_codon:yes stop_codon:yes gene_type:complete